MVEKCRKLRFAAYSDFTAISKFGAFLLIALSSFVVVCIDLKACLQFHKVYPDVIDTVPKDNVVIFYGKKEVSCGQSMTIKDVKKTPKVSWTADQRSLYTLMMTDPDAPSELEPHVKEVCFWWVANIKGNNISTGETLMSYIGPHPSSKKGAQAYVFVVYQQPGHMTYLEDPEIAENQTKPDQFKVAKVAKDYKLGDPIAVNLFQIRHPGGGRPAGPEDCPPYVAPTCPPEDHKI